ncbi:MAG: autotransporter-associated beta strand repeat-containing protein [Verrucomicrobiae bacterium]|nr:autotransporter-associated beta strand repeat-containing protein [Verrucomicrobiae bacterium]
MTYLNFIIPTLALLVAPIHAGTHTWSGAGANTNWSTAANWSSGGVPFVGETNVTLIFPSTATGFTSTPNIANLNIDSIQITPSSTSSYIFPDGGVNVRLTGAGATDFTMVASSRGVTWQAPLELLASCLFDVQNSSSPLDIQSVVSGSGGLTKKGAGTLRFSTGAAGNSFTGALRLEEGLMELAKIAGTHCCSGSLELIGGTCRIRTSHQILNSSSVTIDGATLTTLPLSGVTSVTEHLGPVTFIGGGTISATSPNSIGFLSTITKETDLATSSITAGAPSGSISLQGAVRTIDVQTGKVRMAGDIVDGSALPGGILKKGAGELQLEEASSFTGVLTVEAGLLRVGDNGALGGTVGGTVIESGGAMALGVSSSVTLPAAEAITVRGNVYAVYDSEIAGPITAGGLSRFYANSSRVLTLSGSIGGSPLELGFGGLGSGTVRLAGATSNTYNGAAYVFGPGKLELAKTSGNAITGTLLFDAGYGNVKLLASNQVSDAGNIYFPQAGYFDLNGFNDTVSFLWGPAAGEVNLGTGTLTVSGSTSLAFGSSGTPAKIYGQTGSRLRKLGSNTWTLWALVPNGTSYHAILAVEAGVMDLRGTWMGEIECLGGTLRGSATLGTVKGMGGNVCLCDFTVQNFTGVSPGNVQVAINGNEAGVSFDRMSTSTTNSMITLTGQTLLATAGAFPAIANSGYRIINNTSTNAVTGTFTGLPEGALLTIDGKPFSITYEGGDGNDVELIYLGTGAPGARITGLVKNNNGTITLQLEGPPNSSVPVFSSLDLQEPWTAVGSQTLNGSGLANPSVPNPGNPSARFFRLGRVMF